MPFVDHAALCCAAGPGEVRIKIAATALCHTVGGPWVPYGPGFLWPTSAVCDCTPPWTLRILHHATSHRTVR